MLFNQFSKMKEDHHYDIDTITVQRMLMLSIAEACQQGTQKASCAYVFDQAVGEIIDYDGKLSDTTKNLIGAEIAAFNQALAQYDLILLQRNPQRISTIGVPYDEQKG